MKKKQNINTKNRWEVKAPKWFVKEMDSAEKMLEEVMESIGAKKEWFWDQSKGEYDTEKLKHFLTIKTNENLISKDEMQEILSLLILRAATSLSAWYRFRDEYLKEAPNAFFPDNLVYDPQKKIIYEKQQ
jgi:hypothetical protein